MTTAIYARYSSDLQKERSIDDQIAACEEFAVKRGLSAPFVTYSDAALSGASMATRPGILSLMADVRARKLTTIVSEAIDRLSRDQADVHLIRRTANAHNVTLYTMADGEVTSMNAGLQGIMAEVFLVNLAQKTRRGLKGVARSGRIAGGLCYGYKPVPGKPGERTIDEAEADVVRRIYATYANGASPYAIARILNTEGVAGPRGKLWKVQTLLGDPRIGDGLLCNELYRGRIVFNRRRFIKNPETGKRSSVINPAAEWITVEAPHLRIVDDDLFAAVARMRGDLRRDLTQNDRRRPKRMLSGLLTCGRCGGVFTIRNRGAYACANVINSTGLCEQKASISADLVERRVVDGLTRTLLAPEVIAEAVKTFQEERRAMAAEENRARAIAERAVENARRRARSIAEQLIDSPSAMLRSMLAEAETTLASAESELAALPDASIVALHPNAAQAYKARVGLLQAALTSDKPEFKTAVRGLLDRVELAPDASAADGWSIMMHGKLAALMALAAGEQAVIGRVASGAGAHTRRCPTSSPWLIAA